MDLEQFNRKWGEQLALFRRHAPAPWWGPGLIVTPRLRGTYDTWLPVGEYLADLAGVARQHLPDPSWMPRMLRNPRHDASTSALPPPLSLPDLWATLPAHLGGIVTLEASQIMPLLCALAAPPRYGTAAGRYPEQRQQIARFAGSCRAPGLHYLDLACGTGEGTAEIAELLHGVSGKPVRATGLTLEPLEAWMAAGRHPSRPGKTLAFVAGEAHLPPFSGGFDLVTANGLIGGPMCSAESQMTALPAILAGLLSDDGKAAIANNFHHGRRPAVEIFRRLAEAGGWTVIGGDSAMWLERPR